MSFDFTNKDSLRLLRGKIQDALNPVGKQLGVSVLAGNISYTDGECTVKVMVKAAGEAGLRAEKKKWESACFLYGLKPEHHRQRFHVGDGNVWLPVEFNTRAPKYPLIAVNEDTGRKHRLSKAYVNFLQNEQFHIK